MTNTLVVVAPLVFHDLKQVQPPHTVNAGRDRIGKISWRIDELNHLMVPRYIT